MEIIKEITKDVLTELRKNKHLSTPENYFKEFKKQVKITNTEIDEINLFNELLEKITDDEQKSFYQIESFNDLALLLSRRIPNDDLKKLLFILEDILKPSVNCDIEKEVNSFLKSISDDPQKLFQRDSIKKLKEITYKRIDSDRLVLRQKTDDIIKIISLLSKQYDKTLIESSDSLEEITKIKEELQALNISNASQREIGILQSNLVDSLFNIENSMKKSNEELDKNREKFDELHNTIEKLQEELIQVKEEKSKDYLTGILNRRSLEDEVIKFEKKHSIFKTKYAIIFLDLDKFKIINDKHGHECGDFVLKAFANLLSELTRQEDIIARYGGEEFFALINYNNKDEIKKYIYRLKKIIEKNHFKYEEHKIVLKFSAGVVFRDNYNSIDEARREVDNLLLKAKDEGRDRVVFDDGTELSPVLI